MLTLSLIIPVYNEERHIRKCLDAVAKQTVMPDEVIVVDNNCSDRTIEIAKKYHFVTVIAEKRQGRGYARSAGFNKAKGDILGRIDADSRIAHDWVETAKTAFLNDDELAGITGLARAAIMPGINAIKNTFFSRFYYWFAHSSFDTITMWGANMAIRKSVWRNVHTKVYDNRRDIHEDQDLSLWIAANGGKIKQINSLLVTTNGQGFRYLPKLIKYSLMFRRTLHAHKKNGNMRSQHMRRLGFWSTLAGRVGAILIWTFLATPGSILLFPIDFIVIQIWPKSWWLD